MPRDTGYACDCDSCREAREDQEAFNEDNEDTYSPPSACGPWREIEPYSYRPRATFVGPGNRRSVYPSKGVLYYGVEVEMVCKPGTARETYLGKVADVTPMAYWYPKEDGSLPSGGVELVSHPCDIATWMKPAAADGPLAFIRAAADAGGQAWRHQACGLHVHIDRKALGPLATVRMLRIIKTGAKELFVLSRRGRQQWARYCGIPSIATAHMGSTVHQSLCSAGEFPVTSFTDRLARRRGARWSANRYEALNLCNAKTVEIRIFRSTLNEDSIRAMLALCHGLAIYSRDVATTKGTDTWRSFERWLVNSQTFAPYVGKEAHAILMDYIVKSRNRPARQAPGAYYMGETAGETSDEVEEVEA